MCSAHVYSVRIIEKVLNSFETLQFYSHGPRSLGMLG